MRSADGSPKEQSAVEACASPAAAAGPVEAADAAPPPAAADAAAAPDATAQPPKPADTSERLADIEKNWVGILERVTVHVDAAEQRLQRQLAEEAEPGWRPAPYLCSGPNVTPSDSAAGVALSHWQHSDRCLNAAVGRGEDLKSLNVYQTKMRGALERIRGELAAATAQLAAAETGGQRAEGTAGGGASASASSAGPAPTRSELAKRKWLLGGLVAAAARMDVLVDRTSAMAAQTQELADAAKKTAAGKLAVYLQQALEGEAERRRRQEQAAAVPPLALPAGGFGLGGAAPLAGFGARPAVGFGGYGARPYGGYGAQRLGDFGAGARAAPAWPQYGGGLGLGQAPAGRPGAGLFDQILQQQAGVGQAVDQVGARLNHFAQQLEQQLGQQGRLGRQVAQVRAAAAGLQHRPAQEERPPEWAPAEQRQQAEAEHSRSARMRAMLDTEQEEGEGEAEPGSASEEGGEGEAAGEQQEQEQGSTAAELAAEPSVLSHLSVSPGGSDAAEPHSSKGQAEDEPTDEEKEWAVLMNATRELEEGQQAQAAANSAAPQAQPAAAAQADAAAAEAPAAASPAAEAGADQVTAQQREYIAAQRRRFAEAKQAGEAPPPAAHASPSPPAAPRPASWQPRLPLAPRSVLPPVVEAARAVQQEPKGRAAFGLENSYHTGAGYGKAGGPSRPSTLPLSANKAAGAAAIARAEGLGAWQAPSWLVDDNSDDNVDMNELLARVKAASRRPSKLRFIRRLFPGLSCFLPEEPQG